MSHKSIYEPLGVRPLVNASGVVTVVGACRLLPEVRIAMERATEEYVQLDELMDGVGKRLGELTGAEYGCVTSGAASSITAATAACVTGGDPDKIWTLPDAKGMKNEVIIPSYSRNGYDVAARVVGIKMVEVGALKDLKEVINPKTAMVLILGGEQSRMGPFSLKEIAQIVKPYQIPIVVDAAAEGLDIPNVHLKDGADLVAYSGGKKLRGPQCSGLLLGRKALILAARNNTGHHHGFGRGYKVGREEIMGALTAVEMWFKRDFKKEEEEAMSMINYMIGYLKDIPGLDFNNDISPLGIGLIISWEKSIIPLAGFEVEELLYDGNPRIAVSLSGSYLPFPPKMEPNIRINVSGLELGEVKLIAERVWDILSDPPVKTKSKDIPLFDLSGQWDVIINFGASEVRHRFIIEQKEEKIQGSHLGTIGGRDMFGNIYGRNVLIWSAYTKFGTRIKYTFFGKLIDSINMQGEVSLSEYGKATWKATRHNYV